MLWLKDNESVRAAQIIGEWLQDITAACSVYLKRDIDLLELRRSEFEQVKSLMRADVRFVNKFDVLLVLIRAYRNDCYHPEIAELYDSLNEE